jgi:hypothetical protein
MASVQKPWSKFPSLLREQSAPNSVHIEDGWLTLHYWIQQRHFRLNERQPFERIAPLEFGSTPARAVGEFLLREFDRERQIAVIDWRQE